MNYLKSLGGSPQHRERVFIGAIKMDNINLKSYDNLGPLIQRRPFSGIKEWDLQDFLDRNLTQPVDSEEIRSLTKVQLQALDAWNEFLKIYRKINRQNLPGMPLWGEFWQPRKNFTIARSTPTWKKILLTVIFLYIRKIKVGSTVGKRNLTLNYLFRLTKNLSGRLKIKEISTTV